MTSLTASADIFATFLHLTSTILFAGSQFFEVGFAVLIGLFFDDERDEFLFVHWGLYV